jgi:hypothetical protein
VSCDGVVKRGERKRAHTRTHSSTHSSMKILAPAHSYDAMPRARAADSGQHVTSRDVTCGGTSTGSDAPVEYTMRGGHRTLPQKRVTTEVKATARLHQETRGAREAGAMCTRRDDTHNQNHQRLVQRTGQAQGRQGLVLLECRRYGHRARIADAVPCVRAARDDG